MGSVSLHELTLPCFRVGPVTEAAELERRITAMSIFTAEGVGTQLLSQGWGCERKGWPTSPALPRVKNLLESSSDMGGAAAQGRDAGGLGRCQGLGGGYRVRSSPRQVQHLVWPCHFPPCEVCWPVLNQIGPNILPTHAELREIYCQRGKVRWARELWSCPFVRTETSLCWLGEGTPLAP